MAEDLKEKLGKLLDQYDENRRAVEQRQGQTKQAGDVFVEEFRIARKTVVRPVFEAAGELLQQRGSELTISEEEESVDSDGRRRNAYITMYIFPAGVPSGARSRHHRDNYPHLSVTGLRSSKRVTIYASNMLPGFSGNAGQRGEYQLSQIDKALVERELLTLVGELANKWKA